MPREGFLVISDITGYSKYVNESELEHARDSLAALLNLLIEQTRSPLVISKLEGDAVFSYAPARGFLQGQTLLEMMEITYAAFRKALNLMVLNTTCACNACRNLPNLDLKFFVHYGSFSIQELGAYRELVGHDVNLVHRLAKNRIKDKTSLTAYAAYTQAVIDILDMGELAESMIAYREAFADVGEVQLYVVDMHSVWERHKSGLRVEVKPEEALLTLEYEFPVPPPLLWEYLTKPEYRTILQGSDGTEVREQTNGRTGPGSKYYCAHGKSYSIQTVVDWQPFEQYTTNEAHPLPGISADNTYRLEPVDGGTRLIHRWGRAKGFWLLRILSDIVVRFIIAPNVPEAAQRLSLRIQQDLAEGISVFSSPAQIDPEHVTVAAAAGLTDDADTSA